VISWGHRNRTGEEKDVGGGEGWRRVGLGTRE
jgi:hypothetical protein